MSSAATSFSFSVDNVAPAAPVIAAIGDGGAIGGADHTVSGQANDATVSGTAEANSTVALKSGATTLGTATADGSGNWSYALTAGNITTIGQGGSKTITATATDVAGNVSSAATSFSFSVDNVAPAAPVIAAIGDGGAIGGADHTVSGQANDARSAAPRRRTAPSRSSPAPPRWARRRRTAAATGPMR